MILSACLLVVATGVINLHLKIIRDQRSNIYFKWPEINKKCLKYFLFKIVNLYFLLTKTFLKISDHGASLNKSRSSLKITSVFTTFFFAIWNDMFFPNRDKVKKETINGDLLEWLLPPTHTHTHKIELIHTMFVAW